jgi:hypothetical protein
LLHLQLSWPNLLLSIAKSGEIALKQQQKLKLEIEDSTHIGILFSNLLRHGWHSSKYFTFIVQNDITFGSFAFGE